VGRRDVVVEALAGEEVLVDDRWLGACSRDQHLRAVVAGVGRKPEALVDAVAGLNRRLDRWHRGRRTTVNAMPTRRSTWNISDSFLVSRPDAVVARDVRRRAGEGSIFIR
jgi:hypothetical protein